MGNAKALRCRADAELVGRVPALHRVNLEHQAVGVWCVQRERGEYGVDELYVVPAACGLTHLAIRCDLQRHDEVLCMVVFEQPLDGREVPPQMHRPPPVVAHPGKRFAKDVEAAVKEFPLCPAAEERSNRVIDGTVNAHAAKALEIRLRRVHSDDTEAIRRHEPGNGRTCVVGASLHGYESGTDITFLERYHVDCGRFSDRAPNTMNLTSGAEVNDVIRISKRHECGEPRLP